MPEDVLSHFLAQPLRAAAFIVLLLSLLSLWLPKWRVVTPALLTLSLVLGWKEGLVELLGIIYVAAFWRVTQVYYAMSGTLTRRRVLYCALMLVFVALFLSGALRGFTTWVLASRFHLTPDATPMSMRLTLSAPIVAVVLLYWQGGLARSRTQWREALLSAAVAFPVLVLILAIAALVSGYVVFEPKLPQLSWIKLPGVLFVACGEEALFRGLLQNGLIAAFSRLKIRRPILWGWILASLVFGLAHLRFGFLFVVLATIAGLFYGGVYVKSKRIESAIFTHFWVDALHYLLFTYPFYSAAYSQAIRHF